METILDLDKKILIDKLVYHRQPPVFDREIVGYQSKINNHSESDPQEIQKQFVDVFNSWILNSRYNKLTGLQTFKHRDFCVGVTGFIDDLYVIHGPNIRYFDKEYSYHERLSKGKKIFSYTELKTGDHLIVSAPFCSNGDRHPQLEQALDHCDQNNVDVHIDSAWYGCVRDFDFNYDRPCIKSIGFSLSKGLSCGHNRIGIRYSKEREQGPITIVNDFNMGIVHLMYLGIELMKKYSCDTLQEKYGDAYRRLCEHLDLLPTKAIHTAVGCHPEHKDRMVVGIGPILKMMI